MFADRVDAGRRLAGQLARFRGTPVVVLGLPRGGVPVAREVAKALGAPLDVILVRKLGVPFQPELAMGAIGEDGVRVTNAEVVRAADVTEQQIDEAAQQARGELARRAERFRGHRGRVPLARRVALIVDDGVATGSTARVACAIARAHGASRVVLAVPVAPRDWIARMGDAADEYVSLATPEPFVAVGQFYRDFSQTSDDDVIACLDAAAEPPVRDDEVTIPIGSAVLHGHFFVPQNPIGIVVFAHGSGSSRQSPRNRYVASVLNAAGVGTLLFDLLTREEEVDRSNVFDVDLLARRLVDATQWVRDQHETAGVGIGYCGASTGAAAALWAAAESGNPIGAVVSRGGRPDLAWERLPDVTAPTLLVVGGDDHTVLDLNRQAAQRLLAAEHRVEVVPGATHLFEEAGTLEQAAALAREWFVHHLAPVTQGATTGYTVF